MPYIKQIEREIYSEALDTIKEELSTGVGPGHLNYLFTKISNAYLGDCECYQYYNDIIGALEGCKLELYRRQAAHYEDIKIKENGDV